MQKYCCLVLVLVAMSFVITTPAESEADLAAIAEQFFRGVYGCDASVVDELASEEIVISYPIFETLFNKPGIRGRDAVHVFADNFCKKWSEAQVTIHETVREGDKVVLVWGFQARDTATGKEHAWGGISLFRFDREAKVAAEMGLESTPGPIERFALVGDTN